jgi:hypothetical protein
MKEQVRGLDLRAVGGPISDRGGACEYCVLCAVNVLTRQSTEFVSECISGEEAILFMYLTYRSRDSSVGIATRYGLDGPRIESRWGARFSASVQTCRGAHPAFYTMGKGSLSQGYSGRGVALITHPHLAPRLRKCRAIPLLPLWAFVACYRVTFTFTLTFTDRSA